MQIKELRPKIRDMVLHPLFEEFCTVKDVSFECDLSDKTAVQHQIMRSGVPGDLLQDWSNWVVDGARPVTRSKRDTGGADRYKLPPTAAHPDINDILVSAVKAIRVSVLVGTSSMKSSSVLSRLWFWSNFSFGFFDKRLVIDRDSIPCHSHTFIRLKTQNVCSKILKSNTKVLDVWA